MRGVRVDSSVLRAVNLLLALAGAASAQDIVALTGTDGALGPGLGSGVVFGAFGPSEQGRLPVMDNLGVVYVPALIKGLASAEAGVFAIGTKTTLLVATGDAAPGLGAGVVFVGFELDAGLSVANAGQLAIPALAAAPTQPPIGGTWMLRASLEPFIYAGLPMPSVAPGAVFAGDEPSAITGSGGAGSVTASSTSPQGAVSGIWSDRGLSLAKIVASGEPAHGIPGGTYQQFDQPRFRTVINDNNLHAWISTVTLANGSSVSAAHTEQGNGNVRLVAIEGAPAPGTPGGSFASLASGRSFSALRAGNLDQTAFECGFDGPGPVAGGTGIWRDTNGQLVLQARSGLPIDALGGAVLDPKIPLRDFALSGPGTIAISGLLQHDISGVNEKNDAVLLLRDRRGITPVAREGDDVPSLPDFVFGQIDGVTFGVPVGNGLGQFAVRAAVRDQSGTTAWALCGIDQAGGIHALVRQGQKLALPSGSAIIAHIEAAMESGGQDGQRQALNDNAAIVMWAELDNGDDALLKAEIPVASFCYADCNGDGQLSVEDYLCFGKRYGQGDFGADCDENGSFNIFDYICFGAEYSAGCF